MNPGDDTPDSRRRRRGTRSTTDANTRTSIDALANERSHRSMTGACEIVHETLIRTWPPTASWIDDTRDDLRMRQRLTQAVHRVGQSGARCRSAVSWHTARDRRSTGAPVRSGARGVPAVFLDASRDASRRRERAVAADERTPSRGYGGFAFTVLSALAVAAAAASVVAFAALEPSRTRKPRPKNGLRGPRYRKRSRSPRRARSRVAPRGRECGPPRADHARSAKRDRERAGSDGSVGHRSRPRTDSRRRRAHRPRVSRRVDDRHRSA